MCVVDEQQERRLLRPRRQQAQRRRPDREPVLGASPAAGRARLRAHWPAVAGSARAPQALGAGARPALRTGPRPRTGPRARAGRACPPRAARRARAARSCRSRAPRRARGRRCGPRRACASSRSIARRSSSRPSSMRRFCHGLGGAPDAIAQGRSYGRATSTEEARHGSHPGARRHRRAEARAVRIPRRRGGRCDPQRRAGRHGRQARPVPRARGRGRADARRARAAQRHQRALRARVAQRAGRGRLRDLRPGRRHLHAPARADGRAHRRPEPGLSCRGSSRSRSAP